MSDDRRYYVYILTNNSATLYVGVTNDLKRRMDEHKKKRVPGFTARYDINRLVWYELFTDSLEAIQAEKRLKGWRREKKVALINEMNPSWVDLAVFL